MKLGKKQLPRYKSSKYFAKFQAEWFEDNSGFLNQEKKEMIKMFVSNGELKPENQVTIESGFELDWNKIKSVCWTRVTGEGEEKIVLGKIKPDVEFLDFLNKFFKKWYGGYRKTNYRTIKAVCNFFQENPDKFREMADKARTLGEFVSLMGIR